MDARAAGGAPRDALAGCSAAAHRREVGHRRGQALVALAGRDRARRRSGRPSRRPTSGAAPPRSPCSPRRATSAAPTPISRRCARRSTCRSLCKDFFVDVWQVTEARVHGADAILVLLSLVEDGLAVDLIQAAEDLEMEAIVEVHDGRRARAGARPRHADHRRQRTRPGYARDRSRASDRAPAPPAQGPAADRGVGHRDARPCAGGARRGRRRPARRDGPHARPRAAAGARAVTR